MAIVRRCRGSGGSGADDKKNLAIEALKKLINGDVRSQAKRNVMQSKVFSELNPLRRHLVLGADEGDEASYSGLSPPKLVGQMPIPLRSS